MQEGFFHPASPKAREGEGDLHFQLSVQSTFGFFWVFLAFLALFFALMRTMGKNNFHKYDLVNFRDQSPDVPHE